MSINLMETHHIIGPKAEKIISVMELSEADKSIYQLSNANKPQNREMVLFSLMLQELTYIMSISSKDDKNKGIIPIVFNCKSAWVVSPI